jgi:hypothetical protein
VRRPRALRGPVPLRIAIGGVVVVGALAAGTALAGVDGREGWWAASNAAGTGDVASASDGSRQGSDGSRQEECRQTEDVWVVAGDGLVSALEGLDPASLGPDADGVCAALRVVGETEVATAASLASGLDSPRRADVWVPDSSLWVDRARAEGVQVEAVASLGTSPVVVASSPEALAAAGWDAAAPTWGDVLGGDLPIAVPSLEDSSSAVLALAAARSGGAGPDAGMLTVRTVLAGSRSGRCRRRRVWPRRRAAGPTRRWCSRASRTCCA